MHMPHQVLQLLNRQVENTQGQERRARYITRKGITQHNFLYLGRAGQNNTGDEVKPGKKLVWALYQWKDP